jgi:hypothetical protein
MLYSNLKNYVTYTSVQPKASTASPPSQALGITVNLLGATVTIGLGK